MKPNWQAVLAKDLYYLKKAFRQPEKHGGLAAVERKYTQSHQAFLKRLHALPQPTFDGTLPVHEKHQEICEAILHHQVTIICGETGSGKTTQLPKICLSLGRGAAGLIGHTQPRRLAARSVAQRIAEELNSKVGEKVACKIRFNEQSSPKSAIKLMTDGILLAETQNDRFLTAYDTIIIDEAHERSLNIDFLLGYLKKILPQRPDLKVIITSATIDSERFSRHFHQAPVIEVSGRTFPVDVLYRPLNNTDEDEAEMELPEAIVQAADELTHLGEGDILVFLAGEREIREAATALRAAPLHQNHHILPLFSRLSNAEQDKIFHPKDNTRRIILATNVAETSLTVPRIRYVIDTGLARVKRYSARAKVEQLHVEKISQAAAKQRAGRCGRLSSGVAIRLYSQEDFDQRPTFTDPEIIRSNLAAVILRMMALKLGDITVFPFLESPDQRYINDGIQVLQELGALNESHQLTPLGSKMARLPLDPKISRILLAAQQHHCVSPILVIAAALSIQDPRERPLNSREAAQKAQERFHNKHSDFLTYLNIWDSFQKEREKGLSNKQLIQWCHQHFLSHLRMREWRELHEQLSNMAIEMQLVEAEHAFRQPEKPLSLQYTAIDADFDLSAKMKQKQLDKKHHQAKLFATRKTHYEQIHRALLTGLIANIGMKSPEGHDYIGARGSHFYLFPTSSVFKTKAKWIMAAELTETSKLYARDVAQIQSEWIEEEAPHLVRYHYFAPHWSKQRGEVIANQKVTLYGLTVLPRRVVAYGQVAPEEARELFIRGALVAQECDLTAPFFLHNKNLIKEISQLEHKSRKQDVLVDEEVLYHFYHQKLPPYFLSNSSLKPRAIADLTTFETWRKEAEKTQDKLLFLNKEDLMQHAASHITEEQFPALWRNGDGQFKLSYRFEPHHPLDGITLHLPLTLLNRINPHQLEWLVPGMIREKLTLLIKALPKQIRRICVPVPEFITQFLLSEPNTQEAILPQLAHTIAKHAGDMRLLNEIDLNKWQAFRLPEYCYMNIQIIDDGGKDLAHGRDLNELKQQLSQVASITFRDNSQDYERENLHSWNIGTLPENIQFARGKQQLVGYLGLKKEEDGSIALRLFDTEAAAQKAHQQGVIALMALQLKDHMKDLNKGIMGYTQAAMLLKHIGAENLKDDLTLAICQRAFIGDDELPRNEKAFKEQIKRAKARLPAVKEAVSQHLANICTAYSELNSKLGKHPLTPLIRERINQLIGKGFAARTPWAQWPRLAIYLKAMSLRLDKYSANPARDAAREEDIQALFTLWQEKTEQLTRDNQVIPEQLAAFYWQLEELRVSLFAQELKTPMPVSIKRLSKEWETLK